MQAAVVCSRFKFCAAEFAEKPTNWQVLVQQAGCETLIVQRHAGIKSVTFNKIWSRFKKKLMVELD